MRSGCDSSLGLGWRPAPMPRAYSQDLRDRVIEAVVGGGEKIVRRRAVLG